MKTIIDMNRLGILLIVLFCSVEMNAQMFFHENGFYQKIGNHWTEYRTKIENDKRVVDKELYLFDEYSDDNNYYYIDNGKYQVCVPKTVGGNFYVKYPGRDTKELYPRTEFKKLTYIVEDYSGYIKYVIYQDRRAMVDYLYSKSAYFSIPESIVFNSVNCVVDKIDASINGDQLENLDIPSSVTEIKNFYVGKYSPKFKELTIPESVEIIGNKNAFGYGDSPIETITFKGAKPYDYSLYLTDMPRLKTIITFRPFMGQIWVTGSKKFKSVKNYSGQKVIVRTYLDKDPKIFN